MAGLSNGEVSILGALILCKLLNLQRRECDRDSLPTEAGCVGVAGVLHCIWSRPPCHRRLKSEEAS